MFFQLFWLRRLGATISAALTGTRCTFSPTPLALSFTAAASQNAFTPAASKTTFTPGDLTDSFTPDP